MHIVHTDTYPSQAFRAIAICPNSMIIANNKHAPFFGVSLEKVL